MGKLITLYKYLKLRWREPSTHAALAAICLQLHVSFPQASVDNWFTTFGIVFGALGVFVKEGKAESNV
jgi:hypothetical protein